MYESVNTVHSVKLTPTNRTCRSARKSYSSLASYVSPKVGNEYDSKGLQNSVFRFNDIIFS